ncbi:MAG: tetratricopeptide repeat protein [Acidobacteriota bacterium]
MPRPYVPCILAMVIGAAMPSAPRAGIKKEMATAVSLARKGLWNEAAHRFRLLIQAHPDNPRLWNNLAVAYEATHRYQQARDAYLKAITLDDGSLQRLRDNRQGFELFYQGRTGQTTAPREGDPARAP